MSFWTAAVIIVAIGALSKIFFVFYTAVEKRDKEFFFGPPGILL